MVSRDHEENRAGIGLDGELGCGSDCRGGIAPLRLEDDGRINAARARLLGNGRGFSVAEVVAAAERVTGLPVQQNICPRRAGDPAVLVSDSSKARVLLSWTPRFPSLGEQIAHAWGWLRDDANRP
jgi:UDP-glucose 4-epimerase